MNPEGNIEGDTENPEEKTLAQFGWWYHPPRYNYYNWGWGYHGRHRRHRWYAQMDPELAFDGITTGVGKDQLTIEERQAIRDEKKAAKAAEKAAREAKTAKKS